jgi:SNF2 family DNA or RNA helicase
MWGKSIGRAKEHREEELTTLMQINSVQRKRKDVMKWLPEVTYQTIPVEMDSKQKKLYDQMLDTFVAGTDDLEIDAMNVLTQLIRLRQLCVDPRLLGFEYVGTKTKAMLEFAENNTDPFIVMTTFSSYFKILKPELEKLGKRVGVIDGSISKKEKMDTAERFQRGEVDILLCNIIAAGTGFTLDKADTVVFIDKDFNPANNEQAQDRIVPTTKERYHPINVISLVVADSIDDSINSILERKEDLTKIINKPEKLKSLVHS